MTRLIGSFLLVASSSLHAVTYTVSSNADTIPAVSGTLRYAMLTAISNSGDDEITIQFNSGLSTITLTDHLPVLSKQQNGGTIIVLGESNTIDGQGLYQAFFVTPIASNSTLTATIQDLTLQNCSVTGGDGGNSGGGGALGAGGGIFVNTGASVAAANITFDTCSAIGGDGGAAATAPSGGGGGARGGLGGTGSTSSSIGGGGGGGGFASEGGVNVGTSQSSGGGGGAYIQTGLTSNDSRAGGSANSNSTPGGGGGASGGEGVAASAGGAGGTASAGGGSGGSSPGGSGGFGGGGAGNYSSSSSVSTTGGIGGWGGGGGGCGGNFFTSGGEGGDFAGGGGGNLGFGGAGGFGGGGGGAYNLGGAGGFGGGGGSASSLGVVGSGGYAAGDGSLSGIGGGGAGLGGAIFFRSGGSLTLDSCSFSGSSVTGGTGSGGSGNGEALGSDLFIQSGGTLTVLGTTTLTGSVYSDGPWTKAGSGDLVLNIGNSGYSYTITLSEGTITANNATVLGTGSFVMLDGTTLGFANAVNISNPITLTGVGTFFANALSSATLSSSISPTTGSVVKTGVATLFMTGSNYYTGGTTISEGLLSISSVSNIGSGGITFAGGDLEATGNLITSGNVKVNSSGTLTTNNTFTTKFSGLLTGTAGTTLTLAGGGTTSIATVDVPTSGTFIIAGSTISGSQNLTKTGVGTLQITATNTSTGSTTISAGELLIASQNNIGSGSVTLGGSTLTINSTPATFTQDFFVTGSSTIASSGTTTISGLLTGSSGTTLTLSGAGNSIGEVEVDSGTFTITGNIAGSQELVKLGGGALVLAGTSSYSGGTTVSEGALIVTGSILDTAVDSGTLLAGTGSVGNTQVDGTLIGGYPTGTLTVNGTLDLGSGSQFATVLSQGSHSLVNATGAVTINPDVTYILVIAPGSYGTSTITVLSGSSLTGTFGEVDVNGIVTSFIDPNINYTSTSVTLGLVERSVAALTTGGNALLVASALDGAIAFNRSKVTYTLAAGPIITASPTPELGDVLLSLYKITSEKEMTYALNQMHPAQLKGMAIVQENNAVRVRESVSQRMQKVLDAQSCGLNPCANKKHVELWFSGLGDSLGQDNVNNYWGPLAGYRANTGGGCIGIDERVADAIYVGAFGAYTQSHVNFTSGKGQGSIGTGYGGLYFSAFGCSTAGRMFYGNLSVVGGWSKYTDERNIRYGNTSYTARSPSDPSQTITYGIVNLTAKGNHSGSQILSHADTGFNWDIFGFMFRPFDSFDYISQREEAYSESNAGEWELTIEEKNLTMIRNELGLQLSKCFSFRSSKWILSPKFSWVREIRLKGDHMNMHFSQGGTPFYIEGYFPDRNLFSPGFSFTGMMLKDALLFDLYYNGEFTGGYSSSSIGGQVGYRF